MNNSNVVINGQNECVVVDQAPITLRWSPDFEQTHCDLRIHFNGKPFYEQAIEGNQCQVTLGPLVLNKHEQYHVEILSHSHNQGPMLYRTTFRVGNFGEFEGAWIASNETLVDDKAYYQPQRNTIFEKTIELTHLPEEGIIHLVGLGYYQLYVNGHRVSKSELNTDWTNYAKTVCYDSYDIRPFLTQGRNRFSVELGNGWYNPAPLALFGKYNLRQALTSGTPCLLADIALKDKGNWTICSTDESWTIKSGKYWSNNLYLGEMVDNTFEPTLSSSATTTVVEGPNGELVPSYIPKVQRSRYVEWQAMRQVSEETIIVDFGQTLAGFIDMQFEANKNDKVICRYAEELNVDGSINTDSTLAGFVGKEVEPGIVVPGGEGDPYRAEQIDTIIAKDGVQSFINQFCFRSFRYVEITGLSVEQIKSMKAIYVHTKLIDAGGFRCSNPYLNELYDIAKVTKQNNLHSVFGDCARERLAYGGDIVALAKSQLYMFDSDTIYRKTIRDFIDDQRDNGGMPETAPFMGIKTNGTGEGAGPLAWQLVVIYLTHLHYQRYGDKAFINEVLPSLERQLDYLSSLDIELIKVSCLGDWGSVAKLTNDYKVGSPARDFTSLCFYLFHFELGHQLFCAFGNKEKAQVYAEQVQRIRELLISEYKNQDGSFADNSQTANTFALYFNLSEDPTGLLNHLLAQIDAQDGRITCGIYGQSFLYDVISRYGVAAVIPKWLNHPDGLSHMLRDGNRALKEFFEENRNGSCNHAMFSSYPTWMYQALGGIQIDESAIGASHITIKPTFESTIEFVECWHNTIHGRIESSWYRNKAGINLSLSIPANITQAHLVLDKNYLPNINDVNVIEIDDEYIKIDITNLSDITLVLK